MIPTTPRRRRGRPFGRSPLFVSDTFQFDAVTLLAKSRGAPPLPWEPSLDGDAIALWTVRWAEDGRPRQRKVALLVTATRQPLGGVRRWWRCPVCRRRCRVLAAVAPEAPVECRICLQARYATDYPGRHRRRQFVALFHSFGDGVLDLDAEPELDSLLARRRRGVRRGRRVLCRAVRSLTRLRARCEAVTGILQRGGL
jgi:hypothetical protein